MPPARGGLDLGTGPIGLVLIAAIAVAVARLASLHARPAAGSPVSDRGFSDRG